MNSPLLPFLVTVRSLYRAFHLLRARVRSIVDPRCSLRIVAPPLLLVVMITGSPSWALAAPDPNWDSFRARLKNGGAFVATAEGRMILCHRCDEQFVPASTIKVATTFTALSLLGRDYHFPTKFFMRGKDALVVQGFGDPALTSEELRVIADELAGAGVRQVTEIILDDAFFAPAPAVDGQSDTTNPYDAINGALLANYNTVAVRVTPKRRIESGEPQTPLVPTAKRVASSLPPGVHRVNIGANRETALAYFGELLSALLEERNIRSRGARISAGRVRPGDHLVLEHQSTQSLGDVIRSMLEFSTNLVANQLLITLGAIKSGEPGTVESGIAVVRGFLKEHVGWRNPILFEGAGLSHQNRVTPREMVTLLRAFAPFEDLLPLEEDIARAKTGSLRGVNTIVGQFDHTPSGKVYFALLVNSDVPHRYKFDLMRALYRELGGRQ